MAFGTYANVYSYESIFDNKLSHMGEKVDEMIRGEKSFNDF